MQVSAGARHTCAVKANGDVACWGATGFGQAPVPDITPATLPGAALGAPYSQTLVMSATSYIPPQPQFAVVDGALPAGLDLHASTGALSGTPTADGSFAFTVLARDANGFTAVRAYTLEVTGALLTALGPATVWIGLKNSDAVGLRLDLQAEVLLDGTPIGSGTLTNVLAGSSGFNNALLRAIPLALSGGSTEVAEGAELAIRVAVRRTCATTTGHASGVVRLWYNGQPIDGGSARDAGSRVAAIIDDETLSLFLRTGLALSETAGTARTFVDVPVTSAQACPDRSYTPFGTWTEAVP